MGTRVGLHLQIPDTETTVDMSAQGHNTVTENLLQLEVKEVKEDFIETAIDNISVKAMVGIEEIEATTETDIDEMNHREVIGADTQTEMITEIIEVFRSQGLSLHHQLTLESESETTKNDAFLNPTNAFLRKISEIYFMKYRSPSNRLVTGEIVSTFIKYPIYLKNKYVNS